jgi:protease-4
MASSRPGPIRTFFRRLWWLVDASRRMFFNLLFLAIVVVALVAWFKSGPPPLAEKTALVLDLQGSIAEQKSGNLRLSALNGLRGNDTPQKVQLRDVRDVLAAAAADPKIERAVLVLDDLDNAGTASLHEIAAAVDRFKAAGKQVVAWGSSYDQRQYYIAAHADEVLLHPLGMVYLEGYGRYRNYYRDALDRLGVKVSLKRVGTYKSAAEPYIANEASPASREADAVLYGALWSGWTDAVEKARKLPAGSIARGIDELPQRFAAVGGDAAQLALSEKLVDGLKTRDELRTLLTARGARDEERKTFRQVSFGEYLARLKPKATGDAVGVVVAEGEIVDGRAPAGVVGGLSTSALIRKARDDEHIKAIVLRVNSPGGSVFGSELVRRELEVTRAAGKPVVVSMGDLAASGGYWISTSADEVIADAGTVTGSIGVFGLLPSVDQAFDKLGVHVDGVTTTWLGGARDMRRPLDPRFGALVQSSIDHIYADFTGKVAQARKTTPEKIDAVAQGRVWTGAQALERGLVDRLGSYGDALDSAATRAKLGKDYRVVYLERDQGRIARLVEMFNATLAGIVGDGLAQTLAGLGLPTTAAADLARDVGGLLDVAAAKRPFSAVVHCLCEAP